MFCANCGKQLPGNAKFCAGCGTKTADASGAAAAQSAVPASPVVRGKSAPKEFSGKLVVIPSLLAFGLTGLVRQGMLPLPDGFWFDILVILGVLWLSTGWWILGKIIR